ncbi:preprotein translocase subunit YajC [Candidatus Woesearchaeota archaeon]|jgi:preprotein translocase subunit YajC|nr:preprotein translocase subunit YajC [Candidatus Woesearchaeota archaeon]
MSNLLPLLTFATQEGATTTGTLAPLESVDESPGKEPGLPGWFPFLLIGGLFYLILIRPQAKEQKRRQAVLNALKKGDEVMTNAGIYGKVVVASGDIITLQVADGVRMRFSRAAISGVVAPKDEDEEKD